VNKVDNSLGVETKTMNVLHFGIAERTDVFDGVENDDAIGVHTKGEDSNDLVARGTIEASTSAGRKAEEGRI
jgi:hypothetical protein